MRAISFKGIEEDVTVILGQYLQAEERGRISDSPLSVALFICLSGSSSLSIFVVVKPDESLIPVNDASSMQGSGNMSQTCFFSLPNPSCYNQAHIEVRI